MAVRRNTRICTAKIGVGPRSTVATVAESPPASPESITWDSSQITFDETDKTFDQT